MIAFAGIDGRMNHVASDIAGAAGDQDPVMLWTPRIDWPSFLRPL